jgi:glycosyltransferase involved in cell wall biosynthesis
MMNYARALASSECRVFLCSSGLSLIGESELVKEVSPNIYVVGFEKELSAKSKEGFRSHFPNFFDILNYLKKLFKLLAGYEGQNVIFLYPSLSSSMDYAVLFYGKLIRGMKVYCEINELRRTNIYQNVHPDSFIKNALAKLLYYIRIAKFYLNEFLTKYFDGLICISTSLEKYFGKYNKNILRIPILTDHVDNITPALPQFKFGEKFKMCFTGYLSVGKEGFDIFYQALEQINEFYDNFEFHLYGYGSQSDLKSLLNDLPEKFHLEKKVFYHGYLDQQQILNELKKFNLLVLPRNSNPQTDYGFSTKLGEYLSSGVPVLLTAVSDSRLYLEDGANCFIVEPGSDVAFSSKIKYVISHYSEVVPKMIINAVETVNGNFFYGNYSEKLNRFLQ